MVNLRVTALNYVVLFYCRLQARDDVCHYGQLSTVPPGGALMLSDVGDIRDVAPPSQFTFTSPATRHGWSEQPAEVGSANAITVHDTNIQLLAYFEAASNA